MLPEVSIIGSIRRSAVIAISMSLMRGKIIRYHRHDNEVLGAVVLASFINVAEEFLFGGLGGHLIRRISVNHCDGARQTSPIPPALSGARIS